MLYYVHQILIVLYGAPIIRISETMYKLPFIARVIVAIMVSLCIFLAVDIDLYL